MLRSDETNAWNGFLSAEPKFAREVASWIPGPDPPDVLCTTMSGRTIGVELTKWVEHDQLVSGKARERIEDNYLRIASSEREPRPDNIGMVFLYDKGHRIGPKDEGQFRQQLYACIAEMAALPNPDWDNPQGAPITDFARYPVLSRFLISIWIHPRRGQRHPEPDGKWILFEGAGGPYTHEWMVKAALDRIYSKIDDYEERDLHAQYALDELHLLCHYDDEALLYNTPIHTVRFGYGELAAKVAGVLVRQHGVFDKIFLFHPWENRQVVQVYPVVASPNRRG